MVPFTACTFLFASGDGEDEGQQLRARAGERERESAISATVYLRDYAIPLSTSAISASKALLCPLIYQEHSLSGIRVWLKTDCSCYLYVPPSIHAAGFPVFMRVDLDLLALRPWDQKSIHQRLHQSSSKHQRFCNLINRSMDHTQELQISCKSWWDSHTLMTRKDLFRAWIVFQFLCTFWIGFVYTAFILYLGLA